eukprot:TRINITY_DN25522_c0_g1_i1.p1 TRINITY_DN25522_c0_g1~~TRINITY_DN25522_c0_g1_i1.p1  ORF type:complete len:241 (-),score=55.27 TRINITY_DN25522_c0_g1_i1:53-748(-)
MRSARRVVRSVRARSTRGYSTGRGSTFSFSSLTKPVIFGTVAAGAATYVYKSNTQSLTSAVFQCEGPQQRVPNEGLPGTRYERTLIVVKPDGVQRGLVGEVISRFERKGYKLVAVRSLQATKEFAGQHYDDLRSRPFFGGLVDFFSSGPVVAMVFEGKDVIRGGRRLVGETDPSKSLPGTIRGDYCIEVGRNIIHGSDGPEGASAEIKLWFRDEHFINWDYENRRWVYEKP